MRHFVFNGKSSLDYFTFTKSITRPFLPPINVPSVSIPNRAGAVALRKNEIGVREFTIAVALLGLNNGDLRTQIRALSEFLIYDEDKPLYFSDEPNRIYYARFTGMSNALEEIAAIGEGEIVLTCFDPFAYSNAPNITNTTLAVFDVVNNGSFAVYPKVTIETTVDVPYIRFRNLTTGKNIYLLGGWYANEPVVFDHDKNLAFVEITEEGIMERIALDSEFFPLELGTNTLKVEMNDLGGADVKAIKVEFIERFY